MYNQISLLWFKRIKYNLLVIHECLGEFIINYDTFGQKHSVKWSNPSVAVAILEIQNNSEVSTLPVETSSRGCHTQHTPLAPALYVTDIYISI